MCELARSVGYCDATILPPRDIPILAFLRSYEVNQERTALG